MSAWLYQWRRYICGEWSTEQPNNGENGLISINTILYYCSIILENCDMTAFYIVCI